MLRSPVCTFVGHVDHGKSSILDKIRGTAIVKGEAGGITQCISSTNVSIDTIKKICGKLLEKLKIKITIPGLLFIDTPGHAAFSNLRKRGGNLADISVLVIDINEGLMSQTLECIDILKNYKTPFVIALNKIDLIPGWRSKETTLLENINSQGSDVKKILDTKLYEILGKLSELKLNSERFDRVSDYTKQIAMIPLSAKTSEGIPELLMILTGLAQKYLEKSLKIEIKGPGKGTILEVKEKKGLGTCLDVILYDGVLKVGDQIVIGSLDEVIVTKVRSLIEPEGTVKEVIAAASVQIAAPNLDNAFAGMPILVANEDLEEAKKKVKEEVEEVIIETEKEGIVIKADSLGSLEALVKLLKEKSINIKKASVGDISKKDLTDASAEENPLNKVVLGFNVKLLEKLEDVKVITNNIIYKIIDDFELWKVKKEAEIEKAKLDVLVRPCKLEIMQYHIFRESNPAIVGVRILGGILKTNIPLFKESGEKTHVKSIQLEKESISEAKQGKEVAVSLLKVIVGRQINEGDILYSDIPEKDFVELKELKKYLTKDEIKILKEIASIKRKENPVWGV